MSGISKSFTASGSSSSRGKTGQYSALVAAVIASAVIPTVIANAFYLPHHLLPEAELEDTPDERAGVIPLRHVGRKAE